MATFFIQGATSPVPSPAADAASPAADETVSTHIPRRSRKRPAARSRRASQADSALTTTAESLRRLNGANAIYFEKFGVHQNSQTKEITTDFAEGQRNLAQMSDAEIEQYRELNGFSVEFTQNIKNHGKEMQKAVDDNKRTLSSFGIDQKAVEDARKFLSEQKATFLNVLLDEEFGYGFEKLEINAIPAVFVFGPDGKLVKKYTMDDPNNQFTYEEVEKDVSALLNARPTASR